MTPAMQIDETLVRNVVQQVLARLGTNGAAVPAPNGRAGRRGLFTSVDDAVAAAGEAFDVAVDLRRGSPTFGRWVGERLSAENRRQAWVPEGFAHGFLVLSEAAELLYKTTDYYAPQHERCIRWDDPDLAIPWPLGGATPVVSAKDAAGMRLADAPVYAEAGGPT